MNKINIIVEIDEKKYSAHRNLEECKDVKESIDSLIDGVKISVYAILGYPVVTLQNGKEMKTPKNVWR